MLQIFDAYDKALAYSTHHLDNRLKPAVLLRLVHLNVIFLVRSTRNLPWPDEISVSSESYVLDIPSKFFSHHNHHLVIRLGTARYLGVIMDIYLFEPHIITARKA